MKIVQLTLLLFILTENPLGFSSPVQGGFSVEGILVSPPMCTINNDKEIIVNFGKNLGINKIDGVNYREGLDYNLKCDENTNNLDLILSISGPTTLNDNTVLQTNSPGLGLKIYQDGIPLVIGSNLNINVQSPPKLEVIPVVVPGEKLEVGPFSVIATIRANYQ